MPFLPSASCRNLDLHPVNLRFLQSHLTKNVFVIAPTHLCGIALILFPDLPAPSACAFSLLASVHSTWRSAAALRFIHVSRNEKFAAHLGAFSSGNSITSRVRRRAPKLLIRPLAHCRAKWARPTSIERRFRCWSFSLQGISRLRMRQGGFPLAPLTLSG